MTVFMDRLLAARLEACDAHSLVEHIQARRARDPAFPGATLAVAGGHALFSGSASPINFAAGIGLAGPVQPDELQAVEAFYEQRAAQAAFKLAPFADAGLWRLLRRRGYGPDSFLNAWVLPLPQGADHGAEPLPRGVEILAVGPERERIWADTVSRGFDGFEPTPEDRAFLYGFRDSPSTTAFLLTLDGAPAAAGSVAIHKGVAMLLNAATLAPMRGRGFQRWVIRWRLRFAARAGCDVAFVQATPGSPSQRNIERAGFRLAYTKAMVER